MSETTTLNVRVNKNLKKETESILAALGLSTSVAINMFLCAIVRNNGIPFSLTLKPNTETVNVLEDVMAQHNLSKPYTDIKDLMTDLNADD